jgi:hypothetical protein
MASRIAAFDGPDNRTALVAAEHGILLTHFYDNAPATVGPGRRMRDDRHSVCQAAHEPIVAQRAATA